MKRKMINKLFLCCGLLSIAVRASQIEVDAAAFAKELTRLQQGDGFKHPNTIFHRVFNNGFKELWGKEEEKRIIHMERYYKKTFQKQYENKNMKEKPEEVAKSRFDDMYRIFITKFKIEYPFGFNSDLIEELESIVHEPFSTVIQEEKFKPLFT